jgi:mRNA interferase MazF
MSASAIDASETIDLGDLVWVDFDPAFGHEQGGRRPALVMSIASYNECSSFVLVCPITRSERSWPFKVGLPPGGAIAGAVLVDQIKSIDKRRIVSPAAGKIDEPTKSEVIAKISLLIGLDAGRYPIETKAS